MARKHVTVAEFKAAVESGASTDEMIVTKGVVMEKAEGEKQLLRVRTFEVSNESIDRDGDVIKQGGIEWKNFLKNPVVLFAHNAKDLPIGKGLEIRRVGQKTLMDIEFAGEEANPKAEQVLKLLDGGFLNAGSIGFTPKEVSRVSTKDRDGFDITKSEALEFSIVPVPANAEALHLAEKSGLDTTVCKEFIAGALKGFRLNDAGEVEAIPAPKPKDQKSLYTVGSAAYLLGSIVGMSQDAAYEREWEGDDSQVPEMLAGVARSMADALTAMTAEEISEALAKLPDAEMSTVKAFLANATVTKTVPKVMTKESVPVGAKEVNDTAQTGDSGLFAQIMAAIKKVLPGSTAGGVNDTISSDQDVTIDVVPAKEFDEARALAAAAVARSRALVAAE